MKQFCKSKKFIWLPCAFVAAFLLCATLIVALGVRTRGSSPIEGLNTNRSMVLLEGTGYTLDTQQEQQFEKHQEIAQQQQPPQEVPDEPQSRKPAVSPETENIQETPAEDTVAGKDTDHSTPGSGGMQNTGSGGSTNTPSGSGQEGGTTGGQGEGTGSGGSNSGTAGGDTKAPHIATSLTENQLISGTFLNFTVSATDYEGQKISRGSFVVTSNGARIYSSGAGTDHEYEGNYKPDNLTDGANIIVITVTDTQGNQAIKTVTVRTDPNGEKPVGGKLTIIIEARTLGLGYLVNETVDFYKGESIPYVVDRAIAAAGCAYSHTGSMSSGWYLAGIKKPGITNGWHIPDPIAEKLNSEGCTETGHDANSLSEKDFYKDSGWVFLYNGDFPGTGMSDFTLQDGDTVTIAFTTSYGNEYNGEWFNGSW